MINKLQSPAALRVLSRIGFAVVLLLTFVALLSVTVRFITTTRVLIDGPAADVTSNVFEDRYAARPWLTLTHIISGFFFMVTGPLQFLPAIRNRWPKFHRVTGRVYILASAVAGFSALAIVPLLPVFGTFTAKAASTFGALLFLLTTYLAYHQIRRREIRKHREWMLRSYALGLGIATFRVLLPLLMMPPLRLPFPEAWDTVVWLGFAVNLFVAEVWISMTRSQALVSAPINSAVAHDRRLHRPARASYEAP